MRDTSIKAVVGEVLEDALISLEARSTARLPPLTVGHNDTVGTTVLNCDSSNPVRAGPLKTKHTRKAAVDTDVFCHKKGFLLLNSRPS